MRRLAILALAALAAGSASPRPAEAGEKVALAWRLEEGDRFRVVVDRTVTDRQTVVSKYRSELERSIKATFAEVGAEVDVTAEPEPGGPIVTQVEFSLDDGIPLRIVTEEAKAGVHARADIDALVFEQTWRISKSLTASATAEWERLPRER